MQLSKDTVTVLKNFASLNPILQFKEGSNLITKSLGRSVLAKYHCSEKFSRDSIVNLTKLLSVMSALDEPDIDFQDNYVLVRSGNQIAQIAYVSSENLITGSEIELSSIDVELEITEEHVRNIVKLCAVMALPHVAFVGDGKKVYFTGLDSELPNCDNYKIELMPSDKKFKAIFKLQNMKMIPANYKVQISKKGIAKFESEKLIYWIVVEAKKSVF